MATLSLSLFLTFVFLSALTHAAHGRSVWKEGLPVPWRSFKTVELFFYDMVCSAFE